MNNEPVAWMLLSDESCVEITEWFGVMRGWEDFLGDNEKIVELYTHPVKEQGLPRSSPSPMNQACLTRSDNYISDEVIEQLAKQFGVVGLHEDAGLYEFARAILRKAQEL